MNFLPDQWVNGRKIRIRTIADTFSRLSAGDRYATTLLRDGHGRDA